MLPCATSPHGDWKTNCGWPKKRLNTLTTESVATWRPPPNSSTTCTGQPSRNRRHRIRVGIPPLRWASWRRPECLSARRGPHRILPAGRQRPRRRRRVAVGDPRPIVFAGSQPIHAPTRREIRPAGLPHRSACEGGQTAQPVVPREPGRPAVFHDLLRRPRSAQPIA